MDRRRLSLGIAFCLLLTGGLLEPASALTLANRKLLEAQVAAIGGPKGSLIKAETYAPLGGPEVGAVLLKREGTTDELRILQVNPEGLVSSLLTMPVSSAGLTKRQPFLFLMGGRHLLLYQSHQVDGQDGQPHELGDVTVYDLTARGGPRSVFSLAGIQDLGYQTTEAQSYDSLLRQPSRHFLNRAGRLPVKFDYYRLSFDPQLGQYRLFHHLALAENGSTDEAANFNNRALAEYYSGHLLDASRWLERATQSSDTGHAVMFANQNYIKSEVEDLGEQVHRAALADADEALEDFWQGDFAAASRLLLARQQGGLSSDELAMLSLSLAEQRRWPEADKLTGILAGQRYPAIGDYAYELVKVAEYQNLPQVIEIQLKALEHVDPGHPGLTAALARVLRRNGQADQAETLLAQYLARNGNSRRDLLPVQLELYSIARASSDKAQMDRMSRAALQQHDGSLTGFVALADFLDLSGVNIDVPLEERDRIKAPKLPLDSFGNAPPGFTSPGG